ncbi:MAG: glycosyltransferase family 4 protein [Bacillota bacterium]
MTKKIIFFKIQSFSHINDRVEEILKTRFPECQVLVVDVWEIIRKSKLDFLRNLLSIILMYWKDILLRRKSIGECLFTNTFIYRKIKKIALEFKSSGDLLFTFQTQSLFNAKIESVPHYLYTDHTFLENRNYPEYKLHKMPSDNWLNLEKKIYKDTDLNFTMSNNITRSLLNDYKLDARKVKCVGAGSNIKLDSLMLEERNYDSKKIIFVGRRWDRKGGPILAEAFEIVLKKHPDAHLTILGCSPQLNIPNVEITGDIPLTEVAGYYSRSSIFCLPTKLEPFGIVFLESMMYSLPVVATNIGAIPDFVNDENGILVEPNSVSQLAAALIRLLDDPILCKRLGQQGFRKYQQNYTWDIVGLRMSELIRASLSNRIIKDNSIIKLTAE